MLVDGEPEIVGGVFVTGAAATVMPDAGSDAVAVPSLTLMTMLLYVPAVVGVPDSLPVVVLNVAHVGLFVMANVSVSPLASDAVGWKLYAVPATRLVDGVPEIVGAVFVGAGAV